MTDMNWASRYRGLQAAKELLQHLGYEVLGLPNKGRDKSCFTFVALAPETKQRLYLRVRVRPRPHSLTQQCLPLILAGLTEGSRRILLYIHPDTGALRIFDVSSRYPEGYREITLDDLKLS